MIAKDKSTYRRPLRLSGQVLFLMCFGFLFGSSPSKACHLSSYTLDSIVVQSGYLQIYTKLCIGGGYDSGLTGALASTRTTAFNFFGSASLAPYPDGTTYYSPASLIGDSTGAVNIGIHNAGGFLGSQFALVYQDSGTDLQCITSTPLCGLIHGQCWNMMFQVTEMPDSIRFLAAEGAGNPTGGCYPNPEMMIDFTSIVLPVDWGGLQLNLRNEGVAVEWTTINEENVTHFEVQRSVNGGTFRSIGKLMSQGDSQEARAYTFVDESPQLGENRYRIKQVDFSGVFTFSESAEIEVDHSLPLGLTLSPNPAEEKVDLQISGAWEELSVEVTDLQGRLILNESLRSGTGTHVLDLRQWVPGLYFVRLRSTEGSLTRKLIVR